MPVQSAPFTQASEQGGVCLEEAGAPLLQTVRTLLGLTLRRAAATDKPLLELRFVLMHQKELSQEDVGLQGRGEAGRKLGKVIINLLRGALLPHQDSHKHGRKGHRSGLRAKDSTWAMGILGLDLGEMGDQVKCRSLGLGLGGSMSSLG